MAEEVKLQVITDKATTSQPVYIGEAIAGVGEGSPYWRIKKKTTAGDVDKWSWANGSSKMDKVWDDRASYSY